MKHMYFNMHNLPQKCDTLWSAEKWSSPLYVMMRTSTDFLNNRLNHTAKKRWRRTQKSHQKWIVKRVQMLKKHVELRNKYEKNTSNVRKIRISVWRQFFCLKKEEKNMLGKKHCPEKTRWGKSIVGEKKHCPHYPVICFATASANWREGTNSYLSTSPSKKKRRTVLW